MDQELDYLAWEDVERAARVVFDVWRDQPELRWAQTAWEIVVAADLARYSSGLERARVAARFFALGNMYLDWCSAAHEEPNDNGFEGWSELLDVHPVYLGQLAGESQNVDGDYDAEITANAIAVAASRERPQVIAALREALGGDVGLFLSLWRSNEPARGSVQTMFGWVEGDEDDEDGYIPESDAEIMNYVSPLKERALSWIQAGCPPF